MNSSLSPLMASIRRAALADTPIAVAIEVPVRLASTTMPCLRLAVPNVTAMASSSPTTSYQRQAWPGVTLPIPVTQSGG